MPIFLKHLVKENGEKSVQDIFNLVPHLVRVAQSVYDEWEQDDEEGDAELGFGGICQNIAEEISGVLNENGIDATTVDNDGMGEQHVWAVAKVKEGVYGIDIDYNKYETGGGYNWKKRSSVIFSNNDIEIYPMKDVDWDDIVKGY